jgi:hypothetical protein
MICKSAGEDVAAGDELCLVRGEKEELVQEALRLLSPAWRLDHEVEPKLRPIVLEEIT